MNRSMANVGILFVAQIFSYLIPIVEIPVLARSLGPEAYGRVVMVQSVALLASLFMEYGFGISGVRQVALAGKDKALISRIYGDVLSAKLIIAFLIGVLSVMLYQLISTDVEASLLLFGTLYFLAFGLSPMWLFQGVERLAGALAVEVFIRCCGVITLFVWVREESDAVLALGILASFALLNTLVTIMMSLTWVRKPGLGLHRGWLQIKMGYSIFFYKSANNILMSSGPALISLIGGAQALASYVPAEKIVKGLVGISGPLLTGLFPMISRSFISAARRQIFLSALVSAGLMFAGMVIAIVITITGEHLVMITLGEGFGAAIDVMKLLVWIVPLRMVNQSLGLTFLIPMNKDKLVGSLTLISSFVAILAVTCLSIFYGVLGAAAGFILAEVLLFLSLVSAVSKNLLNTAPQKFL